MVWNCQGVRPKRKELELYLKENNFNIDLSNNQNLILATIYYSNGNPKIRLFETISNLSDNVMFVSDFNSRLEAFGCAKKTLVKFSKIFKVI